MCRLEQESGFFFDVKYFEEKALAGEWEEVEKYLSGFTKVDDNRYSMKIFFEVRKQKYLEALDRFIFSLFHPPFSLSFFFPKKKKNCPSLAVTSLINIIIYYFILLLLLLIEAVTLESQ